MFKKLGKAIFRAVPTQTIQTNYLETFKFDENDNRVPLSKFEKNFTWKIFSDRIETVDRFGIKLTVRTALDRNQSMVPNYLVFRVHPEDVKNSRINVFTVTDDEITAGNYADRQLLVYSNK
jgi:hypothetical protein